MSVRPFIDRSSAGTSAVVQANRVKIDDDHAHHSLGCQHTIIFALELFSGGLVPPRKPDFSGHSRRDRGISFSAASAGDGPSIFDFNPSKVVQQILRTSDYWVTVRGALLGFLAPLIALGIASLIVSRMNRALGPASVVVLAVTLIGFTLSVVITSPAAAEPHLGISSVEMERADLSGELELPPGFVATAYLPIGIGKITSIVLDQNDRLFVASQDGVIVAVDDLDKDGLGESVKFFGSKTGAICSRLEGTPLRGGLCRGPGLPNLLHGSGQMIRIDG